MAKIKKKRIYPLKYASVAKDHLRGEKNGKKFGMRLSIVLNAAGENSFKCSDINIKCLGKAHEITLLAA